MGAYKLRKPSTNEQLGKKYGKWANCERSDSLFLFFLPWNYVNVWFSIELMYKNNPIGFYVFQFEFRAFVHYKSMGIIR